MMHIIGAMAQFERELIKERVSAGMHGARKRGSKIGRPRAYANADKLCPSHPGYPVARGRSPVGHRHRYSSARFRMEVQDDRIPLSSMPFSAASAFWFEQHSRYINPNTAKGYTGALKVLRPCPVLISSIR